MNPSSPSGPAPWLYRASAVLWAMWGLVHVGAGVLTLRALAAGEPEQAVRGIASAVDLQTVSIDYPDAVVAIMQQHGFNLLWFGLVTLIAALLVWRRKPLAIYLAALVGGLADIGYFLFIDLGGYALPPGPQMTWICAAAIISGFSALYLSGKR